MSEVNENSFSYKAFYVLNLIKCLVI